MAKPVRTISSTLFALGLIIFGAAQSTFYTLALLDLDRIKLWMANCPISPDLFFFLELPSAIRTTFISLILMLSILETIAGILWIGFKRPGLILARTVFLIYLMLVFITPSTPEHIYNGFILFYAITLYFFFHYQTENFLKGIIIPKPSPDAPRLYHNEEDPNDKYKKSRIVLIFSIMQIIFSLVGAKAIYWNWPVEGLTLELLLYFSNTVTLSISKAAALFVVILFFISGCLTLSYFYLGRLLNILLFSIGFIVSCLFIIVVKQPLNLVSKLYLFVPVCIMLVLATIFLFLLTNPKIRSQFRTHPPQIIKSLINGIGLAVFCFILYVLIDTSILRHPGWYSPAAVNKLLKKSIPEGMMDNASALEMIRQSYTAVRQSTAE